MTPAAEAIQRAAVHVADGLARQDARPAREAAIKALGPDATEAQITDWLARWRPEALTATEPVTADSA